MQYRRSRMSGATYFFTINLLNRKSTLLIDKMEHLKSVLRKVQKNHPFIIDALVVMPEHLHLMMTLPKDNDDYSTRISLIKSYFSKAIIISAPNSSSRQAKREKSIWQRRFWEHLIRNEKDFEQHVNYIHYNPVKHGYVKRPSDWPYSTIHRYIQSGILTEDWAAGEDTFKDMIFGETQAYQM